MPQSVKATQNSREWKNKGKRYCLIYGQTNTAQLTGSYALARELPFLPVVLVSSFTPMFHVLPVLSILEDVSSILHLISEGLGSQESHLFTVCCDFMRSPKMTPRVPVLRQPLAAVLSLGQNHAGNLAWHRQPLLCIWRCAISQTVGHSLNF